MLLIDGIWQLASGEDFHSINPATGSVVWSGKAATSSEVDVAVHSARAAFLLWQRMPLEDRATYLHAFQQKLTEHQASLARTISEEVGKPFWDAVTEVQAMIGKISVSLAALHERRSPVEIGMPGGRGITRYKPHGVLAVFGPFNFPGHIANGHIVPALAAGNTVLFKPSELTPRVAEETIKLWQATNLPKGVLNLVQGGRDTGHALATHNGIDGILFTGSLQTGIALRRALLEHPEKILALELGGNNPLVVHKLADVTAAVYWTIQSAYISSGQRCTCARRLILTDGNDDFLEKLIATTQQLEIGPPDRDPQPFLGPVIRTSAAERVIDEQKRLVAGGARILVEAKRLDLGPAYVSPGLIDVTDCRTRQDSEVFGPLLQVVRVPDLQSAITEANETQYGLVASLFTEDRIDFESFYDGARAGLINWNRPTTGASGQLPFGGVGRSGNHRPAGYFTVDFCNVPIASLEAERMTIPAQLSPGIPLP